MTAFGPLIDSDKGLVGLDDLLCLTDRDWEPDPARSGGLAVGGAAGDAALCAALLRRPPAELLCVALVSVRI